MACGVFLRKLANDGSNSLIGMVDTPPCIRRKACCLSTTAWGKSSLLSIYRTVKNNTPKNKYTEVKIARLYLFHLLASNQAMTAGNTSSIRKLRSTNNIANPSNTPSHLVTVYFFSFHP